jgi:MFS family permease
MRGSAVEEGSDDTDSPAERDLRFNFRVLVVHGLLGQNGFRLIQAPTFLPTFVSLLAGNNTAVGVVRAVQSLGMFLSPMFSAGIIEHRAHVKRVAVLFGAVMRLQFLFLALIALFAPGEYALGLTWLVLGVLGLALGMQGVAFNFLVSKTIPVGRRGLLLGLRNASATATLFVVSIVGGYLVDRYGFPDGYGYTFATGFVLTALGLVAFAFLREPPTLNRRDPTPTARRVRDVLPLLRSEVHFRRYLVARVLVTAARGATPFYIVWVAREFGISGPRLAAFTILFAVAQGASTLLWGILGDRTGFRAAFLWSVGCWIAGTVLLLTVPYIEGAYAVFLLVGGGWGGFMMSSQNLALEFGTEEDRPLRIATCNSLSELTGTFGFVLAGISADLMPLEYVFCAAIALHALGIIQMRRVAEPRVRLTSPPEIE